MNTLEFFKFAKQVKARSRCDLSRISANLERYKDIYKIKGITNPEAIIQYVPNTIFCYRFRVTNKTARAYDPKNKIWIGTLDYRALTTEEEHFFIMNPKKLLEVCDLTNPDVYHRVHIYKTLILLQNL